MTTTSLYDPTPQTGTVSSTNLTSLYSNTSNFTTGQVNSAVYSVNGGTGVTVNPTTGNVVVSIGQDVATTANVQFANVTATGNLSNNYFTLANSVGTNGQVLTTNGAGQTAWTTVSSLGVVTSVSGSGAGISVSPTTGNVVVTNTGVTSIVAGTNITVSGATGAVTVNATDTNTTYNIDATSTAGGANLNLNGSDSTTDSVKFASGTGITVSRTDANTITITNTDPGSTGVTSITGTTNQINVSSSTGAVTLSTPQDIATTSTPTFAGATLGNVKVGILDDNTITNDSANLTIGDSTNTTYYPIINSASANPVTTQRFTNATNANVRGLALNVQSSGTPTVGFGNSLEFQIEAQPSNTVRAGYISVTSTDLTAGSEDFKMSFGLVQNGAALAEKAYLTSDGDFIADRRLGGSAVDFYDTGNVGASIDITTPVTTSTTTANQVVATIADTTIYRSVKFQVQITSGTAYQAVEIMVIHNGTTAYLNTYGDVRTGANLSTFDADLSGGLIRLLATPTNAVTTYKTYVSAITV